MKKILLFLKRLYINMSKNINKKNNFNKIYQSFCNQDEIDKIWRSK